MKKIWSMRKVILGCVVYTIVALAIGACILLPPIITGATIGKGIVAQKFERKHGEKYEEIAQVFINDINEIGEKYDFSYVRIELLKGNQDEGTILFELSKTGAEYSYTDSDNEEIFSIAFALLLCAIWIILVIVIGNFAYKFIKKFQKKN